MANLPADSSQLDWLDAPDRRRWFAWWLGANWQWLCKDAPTPRSPENYTRIFGSRRMKSAMDGLAKSLPTLPAVEQFHAVQRAAVEAGLEISLDSTLSDLKFDLTHTPPDRPKKPLTKKRTQLREWKRAVRDWELRREALLASEWFAERAQQKRAVDQRGRALCARHYRDPDCRLALHDVMGMFSSIEISRGPNGPSQEDRNAQHALFDAVRWLCPANTKDGPRGLARFLIEVLRSKDDWPRIPAEMAFDLTQHFNEQRRFDFICKYHKLPGQELTDEAKCHGWILRAVVCDDDLRSAFARLAYDAEHRKKGWPHLRSALADALNHITRQRSKSERLRDFGLSFAPELFGNTTQTQRNAWGLDSKSDSTTRPLTRKERLVLANRFHSDVARDGSGKSSAETLITRAMSIVAREIESS